MRFSKKTQGAVSIFLIIVLVPMMTLSSFFVDAGRLRMARGMAESAGDLALNTALTDYDTQLKELYGLLATAQDMEDMFSRLEDYFQTSITSYGVSADDAEHITDQWIMQLRGVADSGDVNDVMALTSDNFLAQKVDGANLANAVFLKKQIIEFMKYRGPINTGLGFVSSLKSFSTLQKQTAVVEKKQEYYEAQQTVMEDLKGAWAQIAAYNKTDISTQADYLGEMRKKLNSVQKGDKSLGITETGYEKLHTILIKDLSYDVERFLDPGYDVELIKDPSVEYDIPNGTDNFEEPLYKIRQSDSMAWVDYFPDYCAEYDLENLPTKEETVGAIQSFFAAAGSIDACCSEFTEDDWRRDDGDYLLQRLTQAVRKKSVRDLGAKMVRMYNAYNRLFAINAWMTGYGEDDETASDIRNTSVSAGETTKIVLEWLREFPMDSNVIKSRYNSEMEMCYNIFDALNDYYDQVAPIYSSSGALVGGELVDISKAINGYYTDLDESKGFLTAAIGYLESAKTKLTVDVAGAKEAWSTAASDTSIKDTSTAKQNLSELNQLDTYLNEENIDKLIKRLTKVRDNIDAAMQQIKLYTYCGVYLGDIDTIQKLSDALEKKVTASALQYEIFINEDQLNLQAAQWWTGAYAEGKIETDWVRQSGSQPNLTQDQLQMYAYLASHFEGSVAPAGSSEASASAASEEEGNSIFSSIKEQAKKGGNEAEKSDGQASKDARGDIVSQPNLPSKDTDGSGFGSVPAGEPVTDLDEDKNGTNGAGKASGALGGLFGSGFAEAVADFGEGLRDKLYETDYILSMFSYDTIEKEYLENHKNDSPKPDKVNEGDILSLKKNDISPENNYSYGSEVEYILYGKSTAENLLSSYGTVFLIRFGFNTIYAFATSEIRDGAMAIATPISAATLGILPVPLVQAILILAISCCESGLDIQALRDGKKVPLYKSSESWTCSLTGLANAAKQKATEELGKLAKTVVGATVTAGAEELNRLLNMADAELEAEISKDVDKISAAATNLYDQTITKSAETAIQELTSLVNSGIEQLRMEADQNYEDAKSRIKAEIKQKILDWGASNTGDSLAAKAARLAADTIAKNSADCIDQLFDAMETQLKSTAVGSSLDGILSADINAAVSGPVMEVVTGIRNEISYTLTSAESGLQAARQKMVAALSGSIDDGAESLKNTLNKQVDDLVGNIGGGADADSDMTAASFFSFAYSDYLRLFVFIGLCAGGETGILLRTADVIQVNTGLKENGFLMKNAAAYVQIDADVLVKPTLLASPLLAQTMKNLEDPADRYVVHYHGVAGY